MSLSPLVDWTDPIENAMSEVQRPLLLVVSSHGSRTTGDPELIDETAWRVERAGSVTEALALLASAPARLIVSDLSLPDAGDLAVVSQACRQDPGVRFLHLVNDSRRRQHAPSDDSRFGALPLSAPAAAVRQAVARRFGGPAWFPPPTVGDHLRLCALGGLTSGLCFRDAGGSEILFEVVFGEIWSAASDSGVGEAVIPRLLGCAVGEVSTFPLRNPHQRRNVFASMSELLPSFGAHSDEPDGQQIGPFPRDRATQSLASLPPRQTMPSRPETARLVPLRDEKRKPVEPRTPTPEEFDLCFAEGLEATLARDYERAVAAFTRALELRPNDARVRFNLERVRMRLSSP